MSLHCSLSCHISSSNTLNATADVRFTNYAAVSLLSAGLKPGRYGLHSPLLRTKLLEDRGVYSLKPRILNHRDLDMRFIPVDPTNEMQ